MQKSIRKPERSQIHEVMTAHDCGQPINQLGLIGQLEGAASMALGYAYLEDMPMEDGKLMNPNLVDYKVIKAPRDAGSRHYRDRHL